MLWMMVVAAMASSACAVLGCYLVLRRISLIGDAISHAVLPGIALAFLWTGDRSGPAILIGAMVLGVLTAFLTRSIHRVGNVPEDASMGVVFTSLFAIGVILMTNAARHVDLDPNCVLYGALEYVSIYTEPLFGVEVPVAMRNLLWVVPATVAFVGLCWKELKVVSFDPALAAALGINVALIHYLLMALVAAVTVASFEAVGSILVIAMLIVPGATAHLLSDRLIGMLIWSVVVAVSAALLGVLGAFWLNANAAGMIAVVAGLQFGAAVFLAPRHGVVRRWIRNVGLALRIRAEDVLAGLYRLEEGRNITADERLSRELSGLRGALVLRVMRHWGWIAPEYDGRPTLTEMGRHRAASLVRAHRLWEAYLQHETDLPLDHLHDPAERMEHFIDAPLQEEIATELEERATDPHGRPIPPKE